LALNNGKEAMTSSDLDLAVLVCNAQTRQVSTKAAVAEATSPTVAIPATTIGETRVVQTLAAERAKEAMLVAMGPWAAARTKGTTPLSTKADEPPAGD